MRRRKREPNPSAARSQLDGSLPQATETTGSAVRQRQRSPTSVAAASPPRGIALAANCEWGARGGGAPAAAKDEEDDKDDGDAGEEEE